MQYDTLNDFLKTGKAALAKGPVALIFVEDLVEVAATIRHHLQLGFVETVVFAPKELSLPMDLTESVHRVTYEALRPNAVQDAVNALIDAAPGIWMYYCYNSEFLFFPFCESRAVSEMLAFHTEERRDAMLTYVVDLYAADLRAAPNAVSVDDAHLDKSGYYALSRPDEIGHPRERQLEFFGGLRWRFEEHIPKDRRKIDRIAIFRAKPNLRLRADHTFSDEEYNTYACPWHNNITAAICSFRTAKALKSNAGSKFEVNNFHWHNSSPFTWHSSNFWILG